MRPYKTDERWGQAVRNCVAEVAAFWEKGTARTYDKSYYISFDSHRK